MYNSEGATFWQQIEQTFKIGDFKDSPQTSGSMKACWASLQKVINKFRGCFSTAKQINQSGTLWNYSTREIELGGDIDNYTSTNYLLRCEEEE
ncbi:uncharacterized protein PGTG_20635 [Puccinia graminis f. sp. tritici CRL 75-36-700-3]|uniref:Uncharacterized protein n=1 Tax=Puccinia graminis f. sp. tritici (strain CRL 75-36-700-3 / race SCCL) TaxID=418459 RepID=H6QNS7_PUCGT|nr:uncharacterized protein PGTG_20635 [Puccinia graminis f. sp. tritici CRL 75-36-700-3]EHS62514.1 hypothetical protein PGTG_20635 [Puccinia graminis f. sp. tritici CRL 75-36-700-3]